MKIAQHKIFFRELFPITFVVLLWLIHLWQVYFDVSFTTFTLYPRSLRGLLGIITSPLVHADFGHLFSNTIPLLVCGLLLYFFYEKLAHRIFFLIYFTAGFGTWLIARPAWHLGASGLVYGLAGFLFLSGVLRRHAPLMVISLLVVFLYGSMVWGVLPIQPDISWEGHLCGGVTGFVFALYYRKQGPQRPVYAWENEDETETTESTIAPETVFPEASEQPVPHEPVDILAPPPPPPIRYIYIEDDDKKDKS